jgi:hypothetical protein
MRVPIRLSTIEQPYRALWRLPFTSNYPQPGVSCCIASNSFQPSSPTPRSTKQRRRRAGRWRILMTKGGRGRRRKSTRSNLWRMRHLSSMVQQRSPSCRLLQGKPPRLASPQRHVRSHPLRSFRPCNSLVLPMYIGPKAISYRHLRRHPSRHTDHLPQRPLLGRQLCPIPTIPTGLPPGLQHPLRSRAGGPSRLRCRNQPGRLSLFHRRAQPIRPITNLYPLLRPSRPTPSGQPSLSLSGIDHTVRPQLDSARKGYSMGDDELVGPLDTFSRYNGDQFSWRGWMGQACCSITVSFICVHVRYCVQVPRHLAEHVIWGVVSTGLVSPQASSPSLGAWYSSARKPSASNVGP